NYWHFDYSTVLEGNRHSRDQTLGGARVQAWSTEDSSKLSSPERVLHSAATAVHFANQKIRAGQMMAQMQRTFLR
ncbi:hypothetical protein, partial [Pseudomonas atacamensis]|uniref:hypothetical protein n=1 Tax=Pseudomonas atacamensis TaxID=2565368 RepID=UPI0024490352